MVSGGVTATLRNMEQSPPGEQFYRQRENRPCVQASDALQRQNSNLCSSAYVGEAGSSTVRCLAASLASRPDSSSQGRLHGHGTGAGTRSPTSGSLLCLVQCSAVTTLKLLMILSLNLSFGMMEQRDPCSMSFPATPYAYKYSFSDAPRAQNSSGS